MLTIVSIVAAVIVVGMLALGLLAVVAGVAAYAFNSKPKALPGYRWRNLQRDADAKFTQRQLDEDYKTLIDQAGYELS